MALTGKQVDHIDKVAVKAKAFLDLYFELVAFNDEWSGTPSYSTAIDQVGLDAVTNYAAIGLTVTDLTEVEYALATTMGAMADRLARFVKVSKAASK